MFSRVTLAVIATVGFVGLLATPAKGQVKLDLANEYAAATLAGLADEYFIESVRKKTNGQVAITGHYGGALGYKSKDQFDAVGDGAVPIAQSYSTAFVGVHPVFALSSMPFLTPTMVEARALFEVAIPYYNKVFEKHNQLLLYSIPYTPTGLWSKTPLRTVESLRNLKMRAYDAASVVTFKNVGAAPVQLSWADVISQLSAGAIGAVLTTDESGIGGKLWEHLGYYNQFPYGVAINMTHMNAKALKALAPAQQKAILDAARETQDENWRRVSTRMEHNRKVLTERGVGLVEVSAESVKRLQKAGEPVLEKWKSDMGEDGRKILSAYQQRISR